MSIEQQTNELNNLMISNYYQPEQLRLEAPKKLPDDDISIISKIETRSSNVIQEIRRFENVVPPVTITNNTIKPPTSSTTTTTTSSTTVSYPNSKVVTSGYNTATINDFEEVRKRFADLRKRAYLEAAEELKTDAANRATINPHLQYMKKQQPKPAEKIKAAFQNKTVKQVLAVAGILGVQSIMSILREEYRNVFTAKK